MLAQGLCPATTTALPDELEILDYEDERLEYDWDNNVPVLDVNHEVIATQRSLEDGDAESAVEDPVGIEPMQ